MKKGFTLIELLAVIVILAIIALIATPIILNIISDTRKEADERSIDMYASAVKNAIAKYQLKENKSPKKFSEIENYIKYDGAKVECEIKEIYSNGKIHLDKCKVENKEVDYTYGKEQEETGNSEVNHLASENVSAVENPTINNAAVGITPTLDEDGNLVPGSTFNIKVNDQDTDGSIFYVLSNDGDYVNLIAQQNITPDGIFTSEVQDNDEWYVTSQDNRYGPQTAYAYLSEATSKWTNIPIIESFSYLDEGNQSNSSYGYKSIVTEFDEISGDYITTITPLSSSYGNPVTYTNMRARLPYVSEITTNTSCKLRSSSSDSGSCPLWMVNYLYSNRTSEKYYTSTMGKATSTGTNYGYWILSSSSDDSYCARIVHYFGYVDRSDPYYPGYGLRPVITILKSDLTRVMN